MTSTGIPSSPVRAGSGSPASPILTPGARVRALLAQFDSDSEGANDAPVGKNLTKALTKAQNESPSRISANGDLGDEGRNDPSSEEDDDLPVRPRGRMAARMQALKKNSDHEPLSEDNEAESAYARIKGQLLRPKSNTNLETAPLNDQDQSPPTRRLMKRKISPVGSPAADSTRSRSASPLFFPSPSPSKRARTSRAISQLNDDSESEDALNDDLQKKPNARFMALVEKQRQKRLAKEAEEAKLKQARGNDRKRGSSPADLSEESDDDEEGAAKKLTQLARPTRKASKKALEEMNRETQRMSRNMQLAHQAQTKKKITKESLLARFNFSIGGVAKEPPSSTTGSSAPNSDAEQVHNTPPTSPMRAPEPEKEIAEIGTVTEQGVEVLVAQAVEELPSLNQPFGTLDKGKGKTIEEVPLEAVSLPPNEKRVQRAFQIKISKEDVMNFENLSDDDLEIVTSQSLERKIAVFEKIPKRKAKEAPSHLILRSLAHLHSSSNKGNKKKSSMTAAEMEFALRRQARIQAAQERAEKIAELKARGIYVQSTEEREKEQQEVEDLVERARQEAADIQRREERKAKKDGTFEDDGLDDDEDDEYQGDEEEVLSGSEEENDEDDDENEDEDEDEDEEADGETEGVQIEADLSNNLVDGEASEVDSEDEEEPDDAEDLEDLEDNKLATPLPGNRRKRVQRALVDSDDEEEHQQEVLSIIQTPNLSGGRTPNSNITNSLPRMNSKTPQSVIRSARKVIPGLPLSDDLPIGLTQAFAATMADSQSQDAPTQEEDSLAMVKDLPEPQFSQPTLQRLDSIDMVSDSQPESQTQPLGLNLNLTQELSQSQFIAQSPIGVPATQFSEIPEPTQDAGYILSPFAEKRFDTPRAPHSTIDTVILPRDDSPLVQRRGRLRRRVEMDQTADSDEDNMAVESAFERMKKASRKAEKDVYDKSKSNAKDAVDEAAVESEDEYAGLGGASDDEDGQENEEDMKMIDDDGNLEVNERELAALHADKERAEDSAAVSKLLEDITTGRLRRKRGAGGFDDLDLSDEESNQARRREAKRREFAKMRRELLLKSDERIGKIAEDPKKAAFLRALEDRDEDDNANNEIEFEIQASESQSQSQDAAESGPTEVQTNESDTVEPDSKQPLHPTTSDTLNRPINGTRNRRKSASDRRPQTLAEIRESVSFLIEDPVEAQVSPEDMDSDPEAHENLDQAEAMEDALDRDEDDDDMDDFIVEDEEPISDRSIFKKPSIPASRAPFSERRTQPRGPVVDRLSLLRQSSSSSGSGGSSKMAFLATSGSNSSFKIPSLLRRATTNSSFRSDTSVSSTGVTTKTERDSAGSEKDIIRKGGGQKSSVGYYKNSRVQQREEQMKKRLAGKNSGGVTKDIKSKITTGGLLGSLFKQNSWE